MTPRRSLALPLLVLAFAASAAAAPKPYRAPRTPFGAPDLEGDWTNASYTQLQRPKEFKALAATPEEARAYEARLATTGGVDIPAAFDKLGQAQSEFPEAGAGLARIHGEIRSSWIVDPPDGKIPYSAAAKAAVHPGGTSWRTFDGPEARPDNERCLAAASTGAPILSSEDANVLKIVQTPREIVIWTEKYHDARIVRLPGAPAPHGPKSWLGDSVGRWEGDTLVVTTDNFRDGAFQHGDDLFLSGRSRVVERFTRTGPRQILYAFTVTDPYLFTAPLRGEIVFNASAGPPYEYACHEGNYSMTTILTAARLGKQPDPKTPAAAPGT